MTGYSYTSFMKRVADNIERNAMCLEGERVLVAVSGGADSVALLECLLRLREKLGIELVVANIDHGIRGSESREDSQFVMDLAERNCLDHVQGKVDLGHESLAGLSTEEAARKERYAFLLRAARERGANTIATGHTLNDQAETVLMRVVWGATIAGLSGIYPVRWEGHVKIVRPLLYTTRKDIIPFLEDISREYRLDSTNTDLAYRRNLLRHEVLPVLEKVNPNIMNVLAGMADSLREDHLFLEEAKGVLSEGKRYTDKNEIPLCDVLLVPASLRRDIFKRMFEKAGGDMKKLKYRHWKDVELLARRPREGCSLDLPGGVRVSVRGGGLCFMPREKD